MSDVKRSFSFNVNNSPITTVVADGKLWLAFYQLGEALGVGNLRKSLTNHVTDSDLTYFLMENEHSGLNRHRFISEKGVFSILQGRRDGKTDSLRLAIRDNIVPALKADRLNIDPIDVDKDADLNIYYFNLNKKRLTAVFIDNDIYFRKGDVAELIKIHQPAFDKYVREHATKKSVCLLNIPNKVNVTTRASFVSIGEVNRILIDRGGQLCDDLREFIAMTVVPKMTPDVPVGLPSKQAKKLLRKLEFIDFDALFDQQTASGIDIKRDNLVNTQAVTECANQELESVSTEAVSEPKNTLNKINQSCSGLGSKIHDIRVNKPKADLAKKLFEFQIDTRFFKLNITIL